MTDYLEELLDRAGPLLEQVRRMERKGPLQREPGAEGPPPSPAAPSGGSEPVATVPGGAGPLQKWAPAEAARTPDSPQPSGPPAPASQEEGPETPPGGGGWEEMDALPSPLLDQLARLERAAGFSGGAPAPEPPSAPKKDGGYPLSLVKPGAPDLDPVGAESAGWAGTAGRPLPPPGGALSWAEEADRAFRRDSRRYDGGFYLY